MSWYKKSQQILRNEGVDSTTKSTKDNYMYHNSTQKHFNSIKANGLIQPDFGDYPHGEDGVSDDTPRIYLSENPERALGFGGTINSRIPELKSLLLRIKKDVISGNLYKPKSLYGTGEVWLFDKGIPPEYIEYYNNSKWLPITGKSINKSTKPPSNLIDNPNEEVEATDKGDTRANGKDMTTAKKIDYIKIAYNVDKLIPVWHDSKDDILPFDKSKRDSGMGNSFGGLWFSEKKGYFAETKGTERQYYLDIKNPATYKELQEAMMNLPEELYDDKVAKANWYEQYFKNKGYDGIVRDSRGNKEYMVFDGDQIISEEEVFTKMQKQVDYNNSTPKVPINITTICTDPYVYTANFIVNGKHRSISSQGEEKEQLRRRALKEIEQIYKVEGKILPEDWGKKASSKKQYKTSQINKQFPDNKKAHIKNNWYKKAQNRFDSPIQDIVRKWKQQGVDLFLYEDPIKSIITVQSLIVPREKRKQGIGTQIMNELINYADKTKQRLELSPGIRDKYQGTTSRKRLVNFYKRFGLVENKGRNIDLSTSKGMYRNHKNELV